MTLDLLGSVELTELERSIVARPQGPHVQKGNGVVYLDRYKERHFLEGRRRIVVANGQHYTLRGTSVTRHIFRTK